MSIVYVAVIGILAHYVGESLPRCIFSECKFPYRTYKWEQDGKIYAKRVGTMVVRYDKTTDTWHTGTYPILYGDITKNPQYIEDRMKIQVEERYAVNSKGVPVPIYEVGWADANETPTHMVLQFTSSHGGAYVGSPGNVMWVDNVKLIYAE